MSAQATFCATLVDEWVRAGVRHAVVSPGSRSTPMALALAERAEVAVAVVLDERSAAFAALGVGMATGVPAVVLCTSGTAAANHHPAVVEADLAGVPLVVCTADRPPELRGVGAPQTIDQTHLFGRAVRWFHDPAVADASTAHAWRSVGARAVREAVDGLGPVHLNLPFRDPLVAVPDALPPSRAGGAPWHSATAALAMGSDLPVGGRGVIVAGRDADPGVVELASALGWPVLADPLSGLRVPGTISAADALCRHLPWGAAHRPDVAVHTGRPWASKALSQWLAASGAQHVLVDPRRRWLDPERIADVVVDGVPAAGAAAPEGWLAAWRRAETAAQEAIDRVLSDGGVTEPGVARALVSAARAGGHLVAASSMPVRDVEWCGRPRADLAVHASRGANGIDGVVSTAVGVAFGTGRPTVCLVGDLAALHDLSGFVAAVGLRERLDLTIVVVDNHGGGIFSFLPQATLLDADRFEQLLGTPQDVDAAAVAQAMGLPVEELGALSGLPAALGGTGVRVVAARTERAANVAVHDAIHAEVAAALDRL